jgi:hypothetical protein
LDEKFENHMGNVQEADPKPKTITNKLQMKGFPWKKAEPKAKDRNGWRDMIL